jgi:plastocyanin
MKKSNFIWIVVLLSFLLAVSGCGGNTDKASEPVEQEPVTAEVQEPELPEEGVHEAGPDVTSQEPTPETPPADAETTAEEPEEEAAAPEEVPEANASTTDALSADNYRVISLKDLKAYPEEMKIKVGTTVEWRNVNDKLQHIIGWNGQKQMGVKPEPILAGESWSFTFNAPGTVKWFSTARPTIQGTIYIEE